MRERPGRSVAAAGALACSYLVLAVLLTWPLVTHLATRLPGALAEAGQFVWAMHAALAAARSLSDPLVTRELFAPGGAHLVLHTALLGPALALCPVTLLWGPVVAANVWVLACLVLNGWCGAALGRRLGVGDPVGWWCGAALAFCPFVAARLGGHYNLLALWEVVLAWLLAGRCRADRPAGAALAWGLVLGLTLLTDYQLALFAAAASAAALLPGGPAPGTRRHAVAALLAALPLPSAVVGVLALHLHAVGGLAPIPGSDATAALAYRLHLADLVARAGRPGAATGMEHAGYPGAALLAGSLLTAALAWRSPPFRRRALPPLLLALVCALLALGPTLSLDARTPITIAGTPILLPYALLLLVGAADVMREPARFVLPMTIAAACAAALAYDAAVGALAARLRGAPARLLPWLAAALLAAVSLADTWPGPLALADLTPLRADPALVALRAQADGIVLDLPTERVTGQWHIGCRYETLDDLIAVLGAHPLVGGYLSRAPIAAALAIVHDAGLMALQPRATWACDAASFAGGLTAAPRAAAVGPVLRRWRVRAVLAALASYTPAEVPTLTRLLGGAGYVLLSTGSPRYLLYIPRPISGVADQKVLTAGVSLIQMEKMIPGCPAASANRRGTLHDARCG